MSPKFRGGSARGKRGDYVETWLDDQELSKTGKSRFGKRTSKKTPTLAASLANATVCEVFPSQCRIRLDEGVQIVCTYRRAQISPGPAGSLRQRAPVAVGDRVQAVQLDPQHGVVDGVCERRNFLARPAPGKSDPNLIHVIAANVDLLVVVASVDLPEFSPGLVDRYLIAAQKAGIPVLLCVTKSDLLTGQKSRLWESYGTLGYRWVLISSKQGEQAGHIDDLKLEIARKTVVFCGHSGVGKTSLFRLLTGQENWGRVNDVNSQTGKGKHTTTSAILYRDERTESSWIDTPGVREFGLVGVEPERLADYFPEFRSLPCSEQGCQHRGEPECQASAFFRHASYRRIYESLLEAAGGDQRG